MLHIFVSSNTVTITCYFSVVVFSCFIALECSLIGLNNLIILVN